MQSPELTQFYRDYLDWVDAGAPEKNKHFFMRYHGLCPNTENADTCDEMVAQFKEAGLDPRYPFNGNQYNYRAERQASRCHLNAERIAWVRDHCNP